MKIEMPHLGRIGKQAIWFPVTIVIGRFRIPLWFRRYYGIRS